MYSAREITDNWINVLVEIMNSLPEEQLQTSVFPLAQQLCQLTEPLGNRKVSVYIIGHLATVVSKEFYMGKVLKYAKSLCQDFNYEIRMIMCKYIDTVCRVLCKDYPNLSTEFFDEVLELLDDEENLVRVEAIFAFTSILDLVNKEIVNGPLGIKGLKLVLDQVENKDCALSFALNFGKIMYFVGWEEVVKAELDKQCLDFMIKFGEENGDQEKGHIIYNFPALCLAMTMENFNKLIMPILKKYLSHESDFVRCQVADIIHELVKHYGFKHSHDHLKDIYF